MYQDAFEAVCNAAKAKTNLFKKNPLGYFVSAMIAGMFIAFGAFISNAAAAPFADAQDPMQKFMNSITFSAALSMVLLAGADLFTGNNFILSSAAFAKKMKWGDVVKIWVVSWEPCWKPDCSFPFSGQRSCLRNCRPAFCSGSREKNDCSGHQSPTERPALQHPGLYRRMVQHQTEKRSRKTHHDHVVYPYFHGLRF